MDDLDEKSVTVGGKRSFFTGALAPYRWCELNSQMLSAEERVTRFADGVGVLGGGANEEGCVEEVSACAPHGTGRGCGASNPPLHP